MADAAWLCSLAAVRQRCGALLALAEQDRLAHVSLDQSRLPVAADYVAGVIRGAYPDLTIPHHARWRHFSVGGIDRWGAMRAKLDAPPDAIARLRIELCIVSVLLDAGAGPDWRYTEPDTGLVLTRSEGLAVASLDAFRAGLFSYRGRPGADADGLRLVDAESLGRAFQVSAANPLAGLDGRVALLQRLAGAGPLGALYNAAVQDGAVSVPHLVGLLLHRLGPVWPSRHELDGRALGDVWPHPMAPDDGFVPFHKLTQWLAYSLLEVFEDAGLRVTGTEALTGLPEYRNGGLLIDLGVLRLRAAPSGPLPVDHPLIVEWRALTVALLDRLAPLICARLGRDLPLSRLLQGGTWDAGRQIARQMRPGGPPPLAIISDGTVF